MRNVCCTRQIVPYILTKPIKVNTQHKTEMMFNFSVALSQQQTEQVAKILGFQFCKVSILNCLKIEVSKLKFDYPPLKFNLLSPPVIYYLDTSAWEMLTVTSFKLES